MNPRIRKTARAVANGEIIDTVAGWESLEREWRRLSNECAPSNPFMTWEWQDAWRRHFAANGELVVIICRDADRCDAILPFAVCSHRGRKVEVRHLKLFGAGISDSLDLLIDSSAESAPLSVVESLVGCADQWDRLTMPDLDADNPATAGIESIFRSAGFHTGVTQTSRRPFMRLTGDWDSLYRRKVSKKTRSKDRSKRRKLENLGDFRLESTTDADLVVKGLETIFEMPEREIYQGEVLSRPFDGSAGRAFFREIGRIFGEKGWLMLTLATLDGRLIGYEIGLRFGGRFLDYYGGYVQEFYKMSPGRLVTNAFFSRCFDDGLSEVDFLRGDENWKSEWTDSYRQNVELRVVNPGLSSRLRRWVQQL